jgi:hypothetical protein
MALRTITGGGAFTAKNISDINGNFAAVTEPDLWVRPQNGNDASADGTYAKPFATIGGALSSRLCVPGTVIGLLGVTLEQVSGPIINDITIVGMGNKPRQATTSGAPNGGGATWLSPSSATDSLLKIRGQGWTVQNIYFNNTCTTATTGCIEIIGGGDPPLTADGSHARIIGNVFTGEANGIYLNGGPGFLRVEGNTFYFFDSTGDCAILAGGSGGTGYGCQFVGNYFESNLTHIKGLSAAYSWVLSQNHFSYISGGVTTGVFIDFTNGTTNSVYDNTFDVNSGNAGIAGMFLLGTNDRWAGNRLSTAVTTTQFSWGDPA